MKRIWFMASMVVCALALIGAACAPEPAKQVIAGAASDRAPQAIRKYGCGACHTIPGVMGAHGLVGPSLNEWARRRVIAGLLPNTPDNLMRWIRNPQSIQPGTIMPNLDVSEQDARDIAAYLYRLK